MTIFRTLPNGVRRRLPNGAVRALGASGPRYADVGGTTGMGVGSGARLTALLPLAGQTWLSFALSGSLDSAGTFGRAWLRIGTTGVLTASANMVGRAELGFGATGRLVGSRPLAGAIAVAVSMVGHASLGAPMAGTADVRVAVQGTLSSVAYMSGHAGLGIAATGRLSVPGSALRWKGLWEAWYEAAADGWAAVDANNRYLAKEAGETADAAAAAVVVTNTRVDDLEDGLEAEASRITALTTRVTSAEGSISSQGTAITSLQTTTTSQGTTLSTHTSQITGLTASISTLDGQVTNIASATELLEAEVDSLGAAKALWGVYLDVNGYVSGVQSINDGVVSEFNVLADVFRLLSPGTTNGLEVQDGYVRAWRSGSQVIMGNGFGASGDLMFYAGPNVGEASASKANATMWIDAVGNAYFGGSLSAGVIRNSAQSTVVDDAAVVETGNAEYLGGTRNVVGSLSYSRGGITTGSPPWSGTSGVTQPTSATLTLQRSVNGGEWSTVGSTTVTGTRVWTLEGAEYTYSVQVGGSVSFTDNSGGTGPINYRTVVSNPSNWPYGSLGSQRTTILATEG